MIEDKQKAKYGAAVLLSILGSCLIASWFVFQKETNEETNKNLNKAQPHLILIVADDLGK